MSGASSSLSFEHLPSEVLEQILAFCASEPISLCQAACTCNVLSEAVSENDDLWKRLYLERWTYQNKKIPSISRDGYLERHRRDSRALKRVIQIAQAAAKKRDYGLGHKNKDPMWIQMCDDVDSFDILRMIARNKDDEIKALYGNASITPLVQCIAAQLLDHVHFRIIVQWWHDFLTHFSRNEVEKVEEGALMISQGSFWSWEDLLGDNVRLRIPAAREKLNELGRQLQHRLDEAGGIRTLTTVDAVSLLRTKLVDEMGYVVANDVSDATNFSMQHVLETHRGAPLILAVIYQCVLRRVGINVDILLLAETQPVLGLPDQSLYLDVLLPDDTTTTRLVPKRWNSTILKPLSFLHVLLLLTSDIDNCIMNAMTQSWRAITTRHIMGIARTSCLNQKMLGSPPKPFGLHRMLTCMMDPEIFKHYNLISEKTMMRRTKAPFYYAMRYAVQELLYVRRNNRGDAVTHA